MSQHPPANHLRGRIICGNNVPQKPHEALCHYGLQFPQEAQRGQSETRKEDCSACLLICLCDLAEQLSYL